ncbi:NAD(P)/FAD-dependent oxidoreductase [Streptomyces sp. NPDC055134]
MNARDPRKNPLNNRFPIEKDLMSAVVVGAGIVGSSVAYHLVRQGVPVTLLEQGPAPATGVTGDSFAWIRGAGGHWPGGAQDLREYVLADYRRQGVLSSSGLHTAATVVLTAGTGVPKLCEPLSAALAIASLPATLARITAPPGLVKTIVASPDFEVREVRDGNLLLVVPHVEGTAAASEQAAQDALQHLKTAFQGSCPCRLLGYRVGRRPMPAHGPLVGYVTHDRSVYVAVMHSAITLAPTVGRLIADELVTGRPAPELRRCRPHAH